MLERFVNKYLQKLKEDFIIMKGGVPPEIPDADAQTIVLRQEKLLSIKLLR